VPTRRCRDGVEKFNKDDLRDCRMNGGGGRTMLSICSLSMLLVIVAGVISVRMGHIYSSKTDVRRSSHDDRVGIPAKQRMYATSMW
jgi:hypothetical protein